LTVYDWLEDLPATDCAPEIVEVRFKNTRKGFYSNPSKLALKAGDIVAVEAALGHDIGVVSLSGELVKEQIRIKRVDLERNPLKKVYRKAKPHDIEKWQQAIALEHDTMIRVVCDIIKYSFCFISLILHITDLHIQFQVGCDFPRTDHRIVL